MRLVRSNGKEPMLPHPVSSRPWQKVAVDVMTFQRNDYVLVLDYYLKLYQLLDKTAASINRGLKSIFARHGIPDELVSDNKSSVHHILKRIWISSDYKQPRLNAVKQPRIKMHPDG